MLKFTIDGKAVNTGDLKKELMRVTAAKLAQSFRDKFSAIRHPETGEFARVVVLGDTLEDMSVRVEGRQN